MGDFNCKEVNWEDLTIEGENLWQHVIGHNEETFYDSMDTAENQIQE